MFNLLKTYPAFRSRDFCLYFFGQGISFVGTWMQVVAQGWLMYQLTGSAFAVGMVNFLGVIPVVAIAPFGGTIVDRTSTRFVLLITSLLGITQAGLFYGLFATGHLSPTGVCLMAFAWGVINGFDTPARYVCIVEVVRLDILSSAKALNGMLVSLGFILGPSIAGMVIASKGVGATFFWNMLSFVPILVLIFVMKLKPREKRMRGEKAEILKNAINGLRLCVEDSGDWSVDRNHGDRDVLRLLLSGHASRGRRLPSSGSARIWMVVCRSRHRGADGHNGGLSAIRSCR